MTVDDNTAGVDALQGVDRADERLFARAAASDDPEDLPALDLEADSIERHDRAERSVDRVDVHEGASTLHCGFRHRAWHV
jgi:hypothetical protein